MKEATKRMIFRWIHRAMDVERPRRSTAYFEGDKNSRHGGLNESIGTYRPTDRTTPGLARQNSLAGLRKNIILDADRDIVEEWKWMGSPVWSRDGMIAVANAHKDKVKITFSHGAHLPDPDKLFNAGLGGNIWRERSIFSRATRLNARALKRL